MKQNLKSYLLILTGGFLVAAGTYFFLAPSHLAPGGVSGAAIIINSLYPGIPIGAVMMAAELILFIIGAIIIGPVFGGRTVFCSFSISGMVLILEKTFPGFSPLGNEVLVQLIFGILICAAGMGIVFNENASTGGTDIIAKIINKYFNISIGKSLLASDIAIATASMAVFGSDRGLYSVLGVIMSSIIIDKVIEGMNTYKQVAIISCETGSIKEFIVNELDRSATIYYAKGAYHGAEQEVITTVVDSKQFHKLKKYVQGIDNRAFITVNEVKEVLGEGFAQLT